MKYNHVISAQIACACGAISFGSCAVGPVVTCADGTKIILTASMLEKSIDESSSVTLPNGSQITYAKRGKDQTMIAKEGIRAWATVAGITAAADGLNAGEAIREKGMTARQLSTDSVKKAETAGKVLTKTFVLPE